MIPIWATAHAPNATRNEVCAPWPSTPRSSANKMRNWVNDTTSPREGMPSPPSPDKIDNVLAEAHQNGHEVGVIGIHEGAGLVKGFPVRGRPC